MPPRAFTGRAGLRRDPRAEGQVPAGESPTFWGTTLPSRVPYWPSRHLPRGWPGFLSEGPPRP